MLGGEILISFTKEEIEAIRAKARVEGDHNLNHIMEIRMVARTSMEMAAETLMGMVMVVGSTTTTMVKKASGRGISKRR